MSAPPFYKLIPQILIVLALAFLSPGNISATLQAAPDGWDPRLDPLGVEYHAAADCSAGCWRLDTVRYADPDESQGLHHIFTQVANEQNVLIGGAPWHVAWPGGNDTILTKQPPEWADYALWDCYNVMTERGGYETYAGDQRPTSDVVTGLGLPQCNHVSFWITWRWEPRAPPYPPRGYFPIVAR